MPRCPNCNVLMTRVEQDGVRVLTCSGCFGTWIDATALLRLTRQPPAASAPESEPTLQELAALVVESNTTTVLRCPECPTNMTKERFHPLIPVEVDRCPKCKGTWLDVGELQLARRLYQEMLKSDDPQVVQLREKLALGQLGMTRRIQQAEDAANWTDDGMLGMRSPGDDPVGFTLDVLLRVLTR